MVKNSEVSSTVPYNSVTAKGAVLAVRIVFIRHAVFENIYVFRYYYNTK